MAGETERGRETGPRRLERMTSPEVRAEIDTGTPIVLPVGSIEQHGPHLPLGTDGFIPEYIAAETAARRRLVVAPPLFYGAYSRPRSGGGRHFPGSVGLPGRVLEQVVHCLVEDWLRQGFRKVIVLSGHFENAWTLLEGVEQAIEDYTVSYDIFPPPGDILWPNGIGFSAAGANAATGKALTSLLIERLTTIIDREVLRGRHDHRRRRYHRQVHRADRAAAARSFGRAIPRG